MRIITVEEHFMSQAVNDRFKELNPPADEVEANQAAFVDLFVGQGRIVDLAERRIAFMDANGIDAQVVGYGNNHPMHVRKEDGAAELCRIANDELYAATQVHPGRLYGYASLPVDDVDAAVDELERCVRDLGFVGAMFSGPFQGEFLDGERFYPIFEKMAELGVPAYLHPTEVPAELRRYYYEGSWNDRTANTFAGFGIGWHYHTAMHLMRFVLSGIFDKLPTLKMIVGHWGELLPYYFDRMDASMPPQMTGLAHDIRHYFWNNVYTDPSGMFFEDDMRFCLKVFAPDHILWAQDYPYGLNDENIATRGGLVSGFLEGLDLDSQAKEDVAHRNAERLFGIWAQGDGSNPGQSRGVAESA